MGRGGERARRGELGRGGLLKCIPGDPGPQCPGWLGGQSGSAQTPGSRAGGHGSTG